MGKKEDTEEGYGGRIGSCREQSSCDGSMQMNQKEKRYGGTQLRVVRGED